MNTLKKIIIIVLAAFAAFACWFLLKNQPRQEESETTAAASPTPTPFVPDPNEVPLAVPAPGDIPEVPAEMQEPCEQAGAMEYFSYDTKEYNGDGHALQKNVLVYLPYGYDQEDLNTRYEMIYLMHGSGSGLEYFLGSPDQPNSVKNMIDHMIDKGMMKPSIIVLCDYYPDNAVSVAGDGDASYVKNFYHELHEDLIPAVETHYHSFANAVDSQGLKDTRSHRVFGGYDMGAVCTWYRLMDSLDDFAYFLPMSGSFWRGTEAVVQGLNPYYFATEQMYYPVMDSGYKKTEFFVFDTVGSEEPWKSECDEQFNMMMIQNDIWSVNGEDQNLLYLTVNGAGTDLSNPMRVLYTALPFFSSKMPS